MKKILTIAVSLFAVSAFAAGVVFKANPLAMLSSSGGGNDKDKKAQTEQVAKPNAATNDDLSSAKTTTGGDQTGKMVHSFQTVGFTYPTISIRKSYNVGTGEVLHDFSAITRSHLDNISKEEDDALFVADLTDLLSKAPELMNDGIAETFKRNNAEAIEKALQITQHREPEGDKINLKK